MSGSALAAEAETFQVLVQTGINRGVLEALAETFSFSFYCSSSFLFFATWFTCFVFVEVFVVGGIAGGGESRGSGGGVG